MKQILVFMKSVIHGHIGSNQMNRNVEPKTFFLKGKSPYFAEIGGC